MTSDYAKFIADVAVNLSQQFGEKLTVYDFEGEPGAHRVAYSIVEIAESATKIMTLAEKLRQSSVTAEDDLAEFKDEIEHVLYHVRDSGAFTDLLEQE